jgi:drug/metabolite transporter (DMT)-like permease
VFNSLVWGLSWWPFRQLEAQGLHPLWATVLVYVPTVAVIVAARPRAVAQLLHDRALWVLMLAAGATNAAFNWAAVIGDVVRVALLFYLMPLWSMLLARWLLKESLTPMAGIRMALALLGAGIVLAAPGAGGAPGLPLPQSLADWLGLVGGFAFALNNVMLKRAADRPEEGRVLAMFVGGAVVAATLAVALSAAGAIAWPLAASVTPRPWWVPVMVLTLSALLLCSNLALQFGAVRLPVEVSSVLMLSEVLFAAVSAALLGAGRITFSLLVGGALIVLTAAWAARKPAH